MPDALSSPSSTAAAPETEVRSPLNLTAAFLVLRLWMGMRLILSGAEKLGWLKKDAPSFWDGLKGVNWFGTYELSSIIGGPSKDLSEEQLELFKPFGDGAMGNIATVMTEHTKLPDWMIKAFLIPLPYAMFFLGVFILLGFLNRLSWWLAALLWFGLAFGQMLLPDEQTIGYLTYYMLTCVLALILIDHNRVRITKW